jgi:hypothetical protein
LWSSRQKPESVRLKLDAGSKKLALDMIQGPA